MPVFIVPAHQLVEFGRTEQAVFFVSLRGAVEFPVGQAAGHALVVRAKAAGVKQSAIARLESLKATPQIDTLFKVLTPMGYKLAIVPGDED